VESIPKGHATSCVTSCDEVGPSRYAWWMPKSAAASRRVSDRPMRGGWRTIVRSRRAVITARSWNTRWPRASAVRPYVHQTRFLARAIRCGVKVGRRRRRQRRHPRLHQRRRGRAASTGVRHMTCRSSRARLARRPTGEECNIVVV